MDIVQLPKSLSTNSAKDSSWDKNRRVADLEQAAFLTSLDQRQTRRGERMRLCANYLIFKILENPNSENAGKYLHKLRYAEFCKVRLCAVCMARMASVQRTRFFEARPKIEKQQPKARYIHLVLTVPNCKISDLRSEIARLNKAWNVMNARNTWPALGFLRSIEVTWARDENGEITMAHPHIHALIMVRAGYFDAKNYMNVDDWRIYWLTALKVPLDSHYKHPYVRAISGKEDIGKAILEIAKYAIKTSASKVDKPGKEDKSIESLLQKPEGAAWFLEFDRQIEKLRFFALGGVFKECMKDSEITDEEMLMEEESEIGTFIQDRRYDWFTKDKAYMWTKVLSAFESRWWDRQNKKREEKKQQKIEILARSFDVEAKV